MNKTNFLLIITFLLISCLEDSEPPVTVGGISGTVYNSQTMEVVQGVTITTMPTTSSIITGADGRFEIVDVPEGEYSLTASHPNYEVKTTTVQVIADRTVSVDLQLNSIGPELSVSENELNFGIETDNLTFHIQNTGIGTMNWSLTKNQSWLTVSPASGTTTTETDIVNVSVSRSNYAPGNYTDVISLSSDANAKSISVIMTIADTSGPQLSVSPASFDFGSSQTTQSFEIHNTGVSSLSWNASSSDSWISIETNSGTINIETGYTNISVNRADLTAGTYTGLVSFTSNGGNQSVSITVSVEEASLSVSPATLEFGSSSSEIELYISNNGSSTVQWQLTPTENWISTNPENGSVDNLPVSSVVSVDRSLLNMGDFDGNIILSYSGNSMTIPVTVSVTSAVLDNPELQITDTDVTSISLAWTRNMETSSFNRYDIRRSTEPDINESTPIIGSITNSSDNTYTDTNLQPQTTYYYKIYAVNNDGVGSASNEESSTTLTQLGNWSVVATLGTTLYGIDVLNDNFAVAVGGYSGGGKIYFYNSGNWTEESFSTDEILKSVLVLSQTDIWAVGLNGVVIHYDGINWSVDPDAPVYSSNCNVVTKDTNQTVWIGYSYDILKFENNVWSTFSFGGGEHITDIYFNESDEGWATDLRGKIYYYNGYGWSLQHDLAFGYMSSGGGVKSIWAENSTDIWVGTDYGQNELLHWNGSEWLIISLYDDYSDGVNKIQDIVGFSSNDLWFCDGYHAQDRGGDIFHWDGNNIIEVTSPTTNAIYDMKMMSSSSGWAVGENGVVLRYN